MEGVSGIKHRPASSYEDTLTLSAEDARTAMLWRVHRQRLAQLLGKLRVGRPAPRTDRYDPFAVRALLVLGVLRALGCRRRQHCKTACGPPSGSAPWPKARRLGSMPG